MLAYTRDEGSWDLRIEVPKRPGQFRPNEHVIYLFGSTILFGLLYSIVKDLLQPLQARQSPTVQAWMLSPPRFDPRSTDQSIQIRLAAAATGPNAFIWRSASLSAAISTSLLIGYVVSRKLIYRTILSIIGVRSPLRAVLIPSFRHSFLNPSFVVSVLLLHVGVALLWGLAEALWTVYATHPHINSAATKDPTRCLLQGMVAKPATPSAGTSYFRHFAFAELSIVTSSDSARRKGIFMDLTGVNNRQIAPRPLLPADATSGANASGGPLGNMAFTSSPVATPRRAGKIAGASSGDAWNVILGQCLDVIEAQNNWVKRRGQPPSAAKATAAAAQASKSSASSQTQDSSSAVSKRRSILKETDTNIVQTPKSSVWDRIASDAVRKPTPTANAANAGSTAQSSTSKVADVWHRLAPSQLGSQKAQETANKVTQTVTKVADAAKAVPPPQAITVADIISGVQKATLAVWSMIPASQRKQLETAPVLRQVPAAANRILSPSPTLVVRREILQDRDALLVWSIKSLAHLAAASLQEDDYGVVQKDLPAILVSFAELLKGLEQWGSELSSAAQKRDEELRGATSGSVSAAVTEEDRFQQQWDITLAPVTDALRNGINDILFTFSGCSLDLRMDERELVKSSVSTAQGQEQEESPRQQTSQPEMREVTR